MAIKYLLPCECGKTIPVEISQAGQSAACSCGKQLTVPTLRGIKQLANIEAAEAPATSSAGGAWSQGRGLLFSLGIFAAVLSLPYAAYHYIAWKALDTALVADLENTSFNTHVDSLPIDQMLAYWEDTQNKTIEQTLSPEFQADLKNARESLMMAKGAGIIGLIALVAVAASLIWKPTATKS